MAPRTPLIVVASALLCFASFVPGPGGVCGSTEMNGTQTPQGDSLLQQCINMTTINAQFCSVSEACCILGVDQTGWIAAAVGWSLAFLVLIVSCACQLHSIHPEASKRIRLREGGATS
ncbi:transmembrane protein 213 [Lethenteron reissneri]|uniref:transmembrane protein 213 n=1 Tax=Lethenteron reissneri TaxID=7753 RepID=UPI002AB636D7|nr:transmembrane protein 213 [Lethenteron reissneri]